MKTLPIVGLLLALALPALGRLNETLDQCVQRYGTAHKQDVDDGPGATTYTFQKNGIDIIAIFLDGQCQHLEFSRPDKSEFSAEEEAAMLEANKGDSHWIAPRDNDVLKMKVWERADHRAEATRLKWFVSLSTKSYGEMRARRAVEQKQRAVQTF